MQRKPVVCSSKRPARFSRAASRRAFQKLASTLMGLPTWRMRTRIGESGSYKPTARNLSLRSKMIASSPGAPSRFCSLMLSANTHGWPPRTIDSAVGRSRSRSVLGPEDFIDPLADGFGHADQRRPFAFETFAGEFFRRVETELGAHREFARGVIENVSRTLCKNTVALRISVRAQAEKNVAAVVNVH